jgi:hypothetical protein
VSITREQIVGAIDSVTGAPSVGIVHDIVPGIVDAIMELLAPPAPAKDKRVVEVEETR